MGWEKFKFSICQHLTGDLLKCIVASNVWIGAATMAGGKTTWAVQYLLLTHALAIHDVKVVLLASIKL